MQTRFCSLFGYNGEQWNPQRQKFNDHGDVQIYSYRRKSHVPPYAPDRNVAVSVQAIDYSHTRKGPKLIQGLDMTVKAGSMYGLTGSSGCGKTTLISCILGIKRVSTGNILLYGHNVNSPQTQTAIQIPGKGVGYMPQDISLYSRFTVDEMILYFGRLYGMEHQELEKSKQELIEFLQLSHHVNVQIDKLSGGQKRRVSFAVALIHSPMLLILDEPTVGMDPLLRDGIWQHLRQLVDTKGLSVIITTHYIEEMKCADTIGVMSKGRLIAEDSPNDLLFAYNTKTLQDAIFAIYKCAESDSTLMPSVGTKCCSHETKHGNRPIYLQDAVESSTHNRFHHLAPNLNVLRAIVMKNIKLLMRNVPLFLFFTILPFLQMYLTLFPGAALKDVNFGVFNEELEQMSNLTTCPTNNGNRTISSCTLDLLSCQFLSQINAGKISLKYFSSREAASESVKTGDIYGYISFSSNFSSSLIGLYTASIEDSQENIDLYLGSRMSAVIDKTNAIQAEYIFAELYKAQEAFMSGLTSTCMGKEQLGKYPLQFGTPIFGVVEEFDFSQFCAPGAILLFMFFYAITASGLRFVEERKSGMWNRLRIAGIQLLPVVVADLVSEIFIISLQSLLIVGLFFYSVTGYELTVFSVMFTFVSAMLAGYAGMSLGFLLGMLCSDQNQVAIIAVASILPNDFLSGMAWPREGMPRYLEAITLWLPCTIPTESIRWVWTRGYGITHPKVWPGPAVFLVYILIFNFATVIVHKLRRSRI